MLESCLWIIIRKTIWALFIRSMLAVKFYILNIVFGHPQAIYTLAISRMVAMTHLQLIVSQGFSSCF
jgi:hypothetical protein